MPKKEKTSQLVKQGLGTGQLAIFGSAGAAHGLTGMVEGVTAFMAGIGNWLFPSITMLISASKIITSLWWLKKGNKNIGKLQDLVFNTFQFMLGCGFLAAGIFSTPAIAGLILVSIFATNALYSFACFCFNFWKSRQESLQPEAREQYKKNAVGAFFHFLTTGTISVIACAVIACIVLAPPAIAPLVIGMAVVGGIGTLVSSIIFFAKLHKRFFSQSKNNTDFDPAKNLPDIGEDFGKGYYGTLINPKQFTDQSKLEDLITSKVNKLTAQIEQKEGLFGKIEEKKRFAKINRLNICHIALTGKGIFGSGSTLNAQDDRIYQNQAKLENLYQEPETPSVKCLNNLIDKDPNRRWLGNSSAHQSFWKHTSEVRQIEEEVQKYLTLQNKAK